MDTQNHKSKNEKGCSHEHEGRMKHMGHGDPEDHKGHEGHEGRQGHASHHEHMVQDFKKRFWISMVITAPVLILSPMIQSFFHFQFAFPYDSYVLFILSTFIFFYGGLPFLTGLWRELKKKQPGMMTLIAVAITVAWGYSSLVVFGLKGHVFFWELVTLIDLMLLGHWIEMRSVMGASRALEELAALMPTEAHRLREDGSAEDVPLDQIQTGDKVQVKPGEKIPADGSITDGRSEVNEAMITGESKPVEKGKGDSVIGGAVNGTGALTIQVAKTGEDSYLSRILRMVREASESKSRAQDLANRAAFWLTVIALTCGAVTLIVWLILGKDFEFSLERTVTVMVITCPHALGLAVPLVIAVITSLSARNGLLIRNRTAFENARNLNVVVFDKTGTLTRGEFGVSDIASFGDWNEDELLRKAASIESNSEHTIAKGIVDKAKEKNLKLSQTRNFEAIPGKGAKAEIDGQTIYAGNKGIFEIAGISADSLPKEVEEIVQKGRTIVLVAADSKLQGLIGLADLIREESRQAVSVLKKQQIEVSMITGDNEAAAQAVAGELGLDSYFAEVLPDKKSEKIKELQRQGKKVSMVGDGVNDAPALAQADVGMAIGAGTDVAIETADVILVQSDPRNVADVIALSRLTHRKLVQNLFWATGYNVIAIPLAAGVLYEIGFVLPPAVGAIVMSVSTIVVAINARLIKYKRKGSVPDEENE